jgi:3-oxoacyl-[acyl-carrier-protein] synthase-3
MYALKVANSILKTDTSIKTIAIIASEKTSLSIDPKDLKSYTILGDLASAIIVTSSNSNSMILNSKFITISKLCNDIKCETGNIHHPSMPNYNSSNYYFKMNSFNLLKETPKLIKYFSNEVLFNNYKYIVLHQPSKIALSHFKVIFPNNNIIESFKYVGNCVSASILYNLYLLINDKKINRGDKLLLFGMGAGLSIGAITLIY